MFSFWPEGRALGPDKPFPQNESLVCRSDLSNDLGVRVEDVGFRAKGFRGSINPGNNRLAL